MGHKPKLKGVKKNRGNVKTSRKTVVKKLTE